MSDGILGHITTEYTFWCATCQEWEQVCSVANKSQAIQFAKDRGWRNRRKHGWVCPKCSGAKNVVVDKMLAQGWGHAFIVDIADTRAPQNGGGE